MYGNKLESINSCPNSYDIDYEELATKGWISKEFLYKKVLKLTQEEIEKMQKQIKSLGK